MPSHRLGPGRGSAALVMDPLVRIADLHKSFGALEVLKGVSIDVARHGIVGAIPLPGHYAASGR